jgi:hypothetical protein
VTFFTINSYFVTITFLTTSLPTPWRLRRMSKFSLGDVVRIDWKFRLATFMNGFRTQVIVSTVNRFCWSGGVVFGVFWPVGFPGSCCCCCRAITRMVLVLLSSLGLCGDCWFPVALSFFPRSGLLLFCFILDLNVLLLCWLFFQFFWFIVSCRDGSRKFNKWDQSYL